MKCTRCNDTVTQDELDRVADSFDFDVPMCFPCAEEAWIDLQQSIAGNGGIPQDEGG